MKANEPKRKIFDAVDMLTEESSAQGIEKDEGGVQMLSIDKIKAFHAHPFNLYEGKHLDDMVESIKEHGVLTPFIVHKVKGGYEMLSGHNKANAAKIAGLSEVSAIVKYGLTEQEAYVYVIEINVIQRSFAELAPSEKAAVLSARYENVVSHGKRNDILREIEKIGTCGHDVHKSMSQDGIGTEYGMTGRNIARYMRVDKLIRTFKDRLDAGAMTLTAAVELSYLTEEEQEIVAAHEVKLDEKIAKAARASAGKLTADSLGEILHLTRACDRSKMVSVKIAAEAEDKYFFGIKAKNRTDIVLRALDAWFAGKKAAHVQ